MDFWEQIEHQMQHNGITGAKIARRLDISRSSAHAIISGKSLPRKERLEQLAEAIELNEAQKVKFKVAYDMAKGKSSNQKGKPNKSAIQSISETLERKGLHPTSPYQEPGAPDLYFEHEGQRYGVLVSSKIMNWDTVLGMSLRTCLEKGLDRLLFVFTSESGMKLDKELSPTKLLESFKIQAVSAEDLSDIQLHS